MIQPVSWTHADEPDVAGKNMPAVRAAIYRIVWNTSMAACMKPPVLRHERLVWRHTKSNTWVACARIQPVSGHEGYWLYRQDIPKKDWPTGTLVPASSPMHIRQTRIHAIYGPTPGELVEGLFAKGIATAASLHRLMANLEGSQKSASPEAPQPQALVRLEHQGNQQQAVLTKQALQLRDRWLDAGLVGLVSRKNQLVSQVESGAISARDALYEIVQDTPSLHLRAANVARQIDTLRKQWQGMGRNETLLAISAQNNRPPKHNDLPSWIDPEEQLPPDHPLRYCREKMEAELALQQPAWRTLGEGERAENRLKWLIANADTIRAQGGGEAFDAAMHQQFGRFSALRYWLTGLTSSRP